MRCDGCGGDNATAYLMFDLCPQCANGLRAAHVTYAEAQRRNLSRDAGCPVASVTAPESTAPTGASPARELDL